jgi:transposase
MFHFFLANDEKMYSFDKRIICKRLYDMNVFSLRKIALILFVSHTTIRRWIMLTDIDLCQVKYHKIHRKKIKSGTPVVEALKAILKTNPLLVLDDIKNKIQELFAFQISKSFLSSILRHKCSMTRKKVKFYGQHEGHEHLVKDFLRKRDMYSSQKKKFISLDETSFSRKGKDVYGFSTKGDKIKIQRPWKRMTSKSCLACLDQNGILQYKLIDGAFNKQRFIDAFKEFEMEDNCVVIMDNLAIHRSKEVQNLLKQKHIESLFIPPYSPWFIPIENAFSLIKIEYYKNGMIQESIKKTILKTSVLQKIFSSVLFRRGL